MPKSCFLFTFLLVCVLCFTVYEAESDKNDLQYWKPTRGRRTTTTVRTDDSCSNDSDDDDKDDDSSEENDASSGDEGTDDETQSEIDTENERRRNEIRTNKGKRNTDTQGRKHESKHHHSKVHTKQSAVLKHKLRTFPTKRSTQTKSRITRDRKKYLLNTKSSAHYRVRGHTKQTTDDDEFPSLRTVRNRFLKKGRPLLRSTRMTPNYEMQKLFDNDMTTRLTTTKKKFHGISIDELSPFSIARQLPEFDCMFPEANITHEIIGRTAEFNDIVLLRVTETVIIREYRADDSDDVDKFVDEAPPKKIVFIVHGLSVMGFNSLPCFKEEAPFTTLLSYYFNHLDKFDIFLIPMANPDGVALNGVSDSLTYTETVNSDHQTEQLSLWSLPQEREKKFCCPIYFSRRPFWNKNNSPQTDCPGVSLDRNFDVAWNDSRGMSSCSQRYPGLAPFSEPETVAIRDLFHRYSNRIVAYLHVHAGSYDQNIYKGDAVLYPRGYTEVQSDDDKYIDLKGEIDEAMRNASFRFLSVAVESLNSWYGPISGSSVDYASTVYGIPYALEVVFQIYDDVTDPQVKGDEIASSNIALVEIWKRMLDVIFNNIWKNSHLNDLRL